MSQTKVSSRPQHWWQASWMAFEFDGHLVSIVASLGLATSRLGITAEALLLAADSAAAATSAPVERNLRCSVELGVLEDDGVSSGRQGHRRRSHRRSVVAPPVDQQHTVDRIPTSTIAIRISMRVNPASGSWRTWRGTGWKPRQSGDVNRTAGRTRRGPDMISGSRTHAPEISHLVRRRMGRGREHSWAKRWERLNVSVNGPTTKAWPAPQKGALTRPFNRADDEIRTRDPHLGKAAGALRRVRRTPLSRHSPVCQTAQSVESAPLRRLTFNALNLYRRQPASTGVGCSGTAHHGGE
ncbi:MAG: hypothetical protein JWM34_1624 [Ilumatobacteraceae bacterium]|nr:hypothetical protein [Ilumatobacteraceae bacterium]